ncbi:MAG: hypothetical protein ACE10A_01295, partial [Acidiferrobacterales bacterium]
SADDRYCIDKSASYSLSRVVGQGERQISAYGRAFSSIWAKSALLLTQKRHFWPNSGKLLKPPTQLSS